MQIINFYSHISRFYTFVKMDKSSPRRVRERTVQGIFGAHFWRVEVRRWGEVLSLHENKKDSFS